MGIESAPLIIRGLSIAREKGSPRESFPKVRISELGLEGDRHARRGVRQVALMSEAGARTFAEAQGRELIPGFAKENVLVEGLEHASLAVLDRLRCGQVLLEITQVGRLAGAFGKPICAPQATCAVSGHGLLARVLHPGVLTLGDTLEVLPRTLCFHVITLSDRAASGACEDLSGPRAVALVEAFGAQARWKVEASRMVISDDAERLESILVEARERHVDIVITTGGTGLGPRDFTPEVVCAHADRLIPGIMDHIRLKYGQQKPLALLSRSVAAVFGRTLVFALPGSPRAVEEYLHEILPLIEHLIFVTRGIDPH